MNKKNIYINWYFLYIYINFSKPAYYIGPKDLPIYFKYFGYQILRQWRVGFLASNPIELVDTWKRKWGQDISLFFTCTWDFVISFPLYSLPLKLIVCTTCKETVYWLVQTFEIFVIEQTQVQFLLDLDRTCNLVSHVDLIGGPALYMVPHLTSQNCEKENL